MLAVCSFGVWRERRPCRGWQSERMPALGPSSFNRQRRSGKVRRRVCCEAMRALSRSDWAAMRKLVRAVKVVRGQETMETKGR